MMEVKEICFGGSQWQIVVCNLKKLRPYGKYREVKENKLLHSKFIFYPFTPLPPPRFLNGLHLRITGCRKL